MDEGLVRVTTGDDGRLTELVLDRELLDRPLWSVAEAIVAAVNEAQDAVRKRQAELVDPQALAAAVDEADLAADRRLAELSTLISDLIRHQGAAR